MIDGANAKGFTVKAAPVSDPMSMVPVSVVDSGNDVGASDVEDFVAAFESLKSSTVTSLLCSIGPIAPSMT